VFITRTYDKELNSFFLHYFLFNIKKKIKNKELNEVLFEEIKKNAKKNNNTVITPKIFHCDFEKDISNTAKKKVFPDINIKTWRYKRALEIKKNKLCSK